MHSGCDRQTGRNSGFSSSCRCWVTAAEPEVARESAVQRTQPMMLDLDPSFCLSGTCLEAQCEGAATRPLALRAEVVKKRAYGILMRFPYTRPGPERPEKAEKCSITHCAPLGNCFPRLPDVNSPPRLLGVAGPSENKFPALTCPLHRFSGLPKSARFCAAVVSARKRIELLQQTLDLPPGYPA